LQECRLHVPSILATNLVERSTDLAERGDFDCFHQLGENIVAILGGLLQTLECRRCLFGMFCLKGAQVVDLVAFFLLR